MTLWEAHAEYNRSGLRVRGLYTMAEVDDVLGLAESAGLVDGMGMLAGGATGNEVIGDELTGGYLEVGYDVLANTESTQAVIPFVRYEMYDLQDGEVPAPFAADGSRDVDLLTFGVAWMPIPNLIFKMDYQDYDNAANTAVDQFNLSAGYIF